MKRTNALCGILTITAALAMQTQFTFCGEIHDAAKSGDLERVRVLLKDHPELVSSRDDAGQTPLHEAAFYGHKEVAELLLANKAYVNAESDTQTTPLHLAAWQGHKDVVELLLANKADVNVKNSGGWVPLHLAIFLGHQDVAELLREHSPKDRTAATTDATIHDTTEGTIHDAAKSGDVEKVKGLLKGNPDLVFSRDRFGLTPLCLAARWGKEKVVAFLLANKAELNAKAYDGRTPLHYAAYRGYKNVATLLLTNKANVNAKDVFGNTPLNLAAGGGYEMRQGLVIKYTEELNPKVDGGFKEVAELLLANKADVNATNNQGQTPLHAAAVYGRKDVAELLLANKANINARDNENRTPLYEATHWDKMDVAELLRQHGGQEPSARASGPNQGSEPTANSDTVLRRLMERRQRELESSEPPPRTERGGNRIGPPPANWPPYPTELAGTHEVRVKNPNAFNVRVGLRSNGKGKDFIVSPNGTESVNVPNGRYNVYFNYSSDPGGLYQGDSFSLEDNGVEITITKVVNGNYGIRKVK